MILTIINGVYQPIYNWGVHIVWFIYNMNRTPKYMKHESPSLFTPKHSGCCLPQFTKASELPYHPRIITSSEHPYLVGGFNPSEKYEFVSWDDDIPN
jgi:hypothetical protein